MLIPQSVLSNVIQFALSQGADFCEIYAEEESSSLMEIKSSKVDYISGKDKGAGIRLFYGQKQFYTYSNSLDEKSLLKVLKSLIALKNSAVPEKLHKTPLHFAFPKELPQGINIDLKKDKSFLKKLDQDLRSSSIISQCLLSLKRTNKKIQLANSEGLLSLDDRPYFFFKAQVVSEDQNQKEYGFGSTGRTGDLNFLDEDLLIEKGREAKRIARKNIKAKPAPAGQFPVIINKGFGGVIFHEACGHGMETTCVADKQSIFADKLNQKIAPEWVSAYDDGTIENEYGFLSKDDEGEPAQKTCLIEKGVLKSYMVDKMGSKKTNYAVTGSGRRQNYKFPPTSRMRNTYIDKGDSSLEEMIKDIDYGLFAETLGGGQVAPGTGNYTFSVQSGYLIKNGKLEQSVKGASLIGNGLDTLSKITKVGKDLELAPGHCGSISGVVPVTVGQPPILVSKITVGGQ